MCDYVPCDAYGSCVYNVNGYCEYNDGVDSEQEMECVDSADNTKEELTRVSKVNKYTFKYSVENYYLNLQDQDLLDGMPSRKKLNNEVYKLKKTFYEGYFIDGLNVIYDKNYKALPLTLGEVCSYMSNGFINEFNSFNNELEEIGSHIPYVSFISPNFEFIATEKVADVERTQKMSVWDYLADCNYYSFGNTIKEAEKDLWPIFHRERRYIDSL
jgi:hypothetical protein